MAEEHEIITAAQLEAMTPEERQQAFDARTATSWDDVPEPFRSHVVATAQRLADERHPLAGS